MNEEAIETTGTQVEGTNETKSETGILGDSEILVTSPVDPRTMTVIETGNGEVNVIHEITLGDVILSTLLLAMLIFMVLDRVIRR